MNKNKIVTINGQRYDAHTGMPLGDKVTSAESSQPTPATGVHSAPQKSQTLARRATKKPISAAANQVRRAPGRMMDIARNNKVVRFAPRETPAAAAVAQTPNVSAAIHPIVSKVSQLHAALQAPAVQAEPKTSKQIKQEAIETALAAPKPKQTKKTFLQRHPRFLNIFSISVLIIIVGVYVTYLNMPSLSVRVAAAQAGIDATYPEYRPDGYRLDGPVTFNEGQVTINFAANTGSSKFSVKQSKSSWDSSAVLDNIVRKKVGEKYITNRERGLTVYTYNGNAVWVNAGILYQIEGNAPLSGEQIRRIATSL